MAKSAAEITSDTFQDVISGLEQKVINELIQGIILKLDTQDGRIVQNESNTKLLNSLKREIESAFRKAGYYSEVETYLSSFDEITKEVIDIHKELNDIEVSTRLLNPTKNTFVEATAENLLTGGVNVEFINPIRQGLFGNINQGSTVVQLERSIRRTINKRLQRWAGQVARDASFQYDGQAHALIKEQFNLNAVRYLGTIVNDSRAQCKKWLEMRVLSDEEIKEQVAWALKPNSSYKGQRVGGFIPSTTPETFIINRGGYNCRHRAIPTRI